MIYGKVLYLFLFACLFLFPQPALSAEAKLGWAHESEASAVISSGNADNQTYSVSQKTDYAWEKDAIKTHARYLLGKALGEETARNWAFGSRYERVIFPSLSGFLGYQLDSNIFANLDYRHTVDSGARYSWLSGSPHTLNSELGYRLTDEKQLNPTQKLTSHFLRLYSEWGSQWSDTLASRLYVEYLPNLTRSNDWQLNSEISLSVKLNSLLSFKTAYLFLFRNLPAGEGKKQLDTLFTNALVAKF